MRDAGFTRVPKDETPTITVFFAKGAASSIEIPRKEIP